MTYRALLFVYLSTFGLGANGEPQKHALLVGVGEYQSRSVARLRGPANDVAAMRSLLVNRYGFPEDQITVLLDADATRDAVLVSFREKLIAPAGKDDIVLFYFSGHGSQIRDVSGDEADGLDETLVVHDSRMPDVFDITDDELNLLFGELTAKTDNVTAILDSCHSGTATRGTARAKSAPIDLRVPPDSSTGLSGRDGAAGFRATGARFVLISGSRSDQYSFEDVLDGRPQGVLTHNLVKTLAGAPGDITYRELMESLRGAVSRRYPLQHPQIEGADFDAVVFGDRSLTIQPYVLVDPEGRGRASVRAGRALGIVPGTRLSLYAPGTRDFSVRNAVGELLVDEALVDRAGGTLKDIRRIAAGSRALVAAHPFGGRISEAWLDPQIKPWMMALISQAISETGSVKIGGSSESADFLVMPDGDVLTLLARDGTELGIAANDGDGAKSTAQRIGQWARWRSVAELDNSSSSLDVSASFQLALADADSPPPESVTNGSAVTLTVHNHAARDLYLNVINLTSTGRIKQIFPTAGAQELLPQGSRFARNIRLTVPDGETSVVDQFKVVVSSVPVDTSLLDQDAIGSGARRAEEADMNALERLLYLRGTVQARDGEVLEIDDWATRDLWITVVRAEPLLDQPRFAVHFPAPIDAGALRSRLAGIRSLCPVGFEDCAELSPLDAAGTHFEVVAPLLNARASVGSLQVPSVGVAFQQAYELGEQLGAEYAEPLIDVHIQGAAEEMSPQPRGGGADDDPIAQEDDSWSLRYSGVNRAWSLRRAAGSNAGREAAGIVFAHPDTGYTKHPEIWLTAAAPPILAGRGRNYAEGNEDASDLLAEGTLKHPGHGTGSSSVIISPPGCQLPAQPGCVYGVAAGAQLVPLRVSTSVVQFRTQALSRAIRDAVEQKLGGPIDIVSIAMGGPPSRTLWKAVEAAEEEGIVVVSAAGNYVRTVVWPARFRATIAVAAINPQCLPWKHSSRGTAVDISAPGESVWRAHVDENGDFTNGMGKGTTFATGTTAGAAGLWLAHHANNRELARLKRNGELTRAFREVLTASAWRPGDSTRQPPEGVTCPIGVSWSTRRHGAGVLDAGSLLEMPLGLAQARPIAVADAGRVPMFAEIYGENESARAVEDYVRLFHGAPLEETAGLEGEVLYHYTMADDVTNALDTLLRGERSEAAFGRLRQALLTKDLSPRLRAALRRASP